MAWQENGELSQCDRTALVQTLQRAEADGIGIELLRLQPVGADQSAREPMIRRAAMAAP